MEKHCRQDEYGNYIQNSPAVQGSLPPLSNKKGNYIAWNRVIYLPFFSFQKERALGIRNKGPFIRKILEHLFILRPPPL